jgi:glycosyltransferase involved in cell wall biosynthesis
LIACLAQTEDDLEVIVVDAGSTDDSKTVVESIMDNRVKYFYKENGGTSSARNFGLAHRRGRYIAFQDHDDLWPSDYLRTMITDLETEPELGVAYSPITVLHSDGRKIQSTKNPKASRASFRRNDISRR